MQFRYHLGPGPACSQMPSSGADAPLSPLSALVGLDPAGCISQDPSVGFPVGLANGGHC